LNALSKRRRQQGHNGILPKSETAASAAVRQAEAQFAASGNQLEYTRLTADFAGVVAAVNGEAGQIAAAGVPMITLIKNGEKEVHFLFRKHRAGKIKVGQKVSVSLLGARTDERGRYRQGNCSCADTVTRTYKARLALEDAPSRSSSA
jgi:multidrug resistance efflux pump